MHDRSPKDVYEFSKLTSNHRQIMDDFTQTVVMTMFGEYLSNFKDPNAALQHYMNTWAKHAVNQKELEVEALCSEHESMYDMVAGAAIVGSEDLRQFRKDVYNFKDMVLTTLAVPEDVE